MSKFKLKKPGEGTRQRRKANYGEGGRAVGGAARNKALKAKVSAKGAVSKTKSKPPPTFDDLPAPGGHPADLTAQASKEGYDVAGGKDNAFDRLRKITQRAKTQADGAKQTATLAGVLSKQVDDEFLDDLFENRNEVQRPTHTHAEREALLAQQKRRLPILREETGHVTVDGGRAEAVLDDDAESPGKEETTAEHSGAEESTDDDSDETQAIVEAAPRDLAAQEAQERSRKTEYTLMQQQELAGIMGMPGVVCNRCPAAESCPEFKENSSCAYDEYFQGLSTRNVNNLLPSLESFADMQAMRARRAVFLEQRVTGGQIDPNVTRQIEIAASAAERVAKLKGAFATAQKQSVTVIAQGQSPHQGGGILSKLMSGITGAAPQQPGEIGLNEPEIIEAKVTVKAEQEEHTTDVLKESDVDDKTR